MTELKTKNSPSSLSNYVNRFDELRSVFDNMPDGVVAILDQELNIATANKAIAEMLHVSLQDVIGKKSTELFKKNIPGLSEVIKKTIKDKKGVRNYTIEFIKPNGELTSFLVSTTIIEEIGAVDTGIVLILHDVSEVTRLRKIALQMQRYGEIIGKSKNMKEIYTLIESIKDYNTSILILGETGTGKELMARTIHRKSNRGDKPFVPVSCSALPDNLIESELFGHVKGAFTGADTERAGRFEVANGGTLFLDEVGTLSLETQIKLLRVLQERVVERLGSSKNIPVNVRIISATNRDLVELAAKNEFREDLYYRLKVMQVNIPPLRDRNEDIPLLVDYFITKLNRYYNKNIVGVSPSAKELLINYLWPGNIRELENAIEHAFVLTEGALLEERNLPLELRHANSNGTPPPPSEENPSEDEEEIKRALFAERGNVSKAAKTLGMHRATLWRKMREFRIEKGFGKNV
ncbi:sigma 54-interacting transcriptional regulator [candidate division KSB1 bacterium]|nr:sigma 54-interacting transcriptional regulator [candidate division KSB1 bacterium]